MKTSAEIYEVILATARRQAETSAQGKAIVNSPILRTADDLDMLLAMICGNIASYVTLRSDLEEIQDKIRLLADECTKMARDLRGRMTAIGDINAMWVANQLREILNEGAKIRCPAREHAKHVGDVCEGTCCTNCGGPIDANEECRC